MKVSPKVPHVSNKKKCLVISPWKNVVSPYDREHSQTILELTGSSRSEPDRQILIPSLNTTKILGTNHKVEETEGLKEIRQKRDPRTQGKNPAI